MRKKDEKEISQILAQGFKPVAPPIDLGLLIINSTNNLQASLNRIITEFSAFLYAIKKSYPAIYELMEAGILINEYINRKIIADNCRSSLGTIDLNELAEMEREIDQLALRLVEKGSGYLDDAICQYEAYVKEAATNPA